MAYALPFAISKAAQTNEDIICTRVVASNHSAFHRRLQMSYVAFQPPLTAGTYVQRSIIEAWHVSLRPSSRLSWVMHRSVTICNDIRQQCTSISLNTVHWLGTGCPAKRTRNRDSARHCHKRCGGASSVYTYLLQNHHPSSRAK